jgi:hypothetical protein
MNRVSLVGGQVTAELLSRLCISVVGSRNNTSAKARRHNLWEKEVFDVTELARFVEHEALGAPSGITEALAVGKGHLWEDDHVAAWAIHTAVDGVRALLGVAANLGASPAKDLSIHQFQGFPP